MYTVYKTVFNEVIKHLQGPCELHLNCIQKRLHCRWCHLPILGVQSMLVINPFLSWCGVVVFSSSMV